MQIGTGQVCCGQMLEQLLLIGHVTQANVLTVRPQLLARKRDSWLALEPTRGRRRTRLVPQVTFPKGGTGSGAASGKFSTMSLKSILSFLRPKWAEEGDTPRGS